MKPAVRCEGLEVRAAGRSILGPLDLEITSGEYLLLVGPSGSGKSTLLRAIAGLTVPVAGTVELFGEVASLPGRMVMEPRRRGVGFVFQGGALWPHMSVGRTLHFALSAAGVPRAERAQRVAELLEDVALAGFEERMPGTLSGGEAQRLALARALVTSPRLLLLDEPLGMLDAALRANLMQMLAALHERKGWTTVHVTHDPAEADGVATRLVRLEQGRLTESTEVER